MRMPCLTVGVLFCMLVVMFAEEPAGSTVVGGFVVPAMALMEKEVLSDGSVHWKTDLPRIKEWSGHPLAEPAYDVTLSPMLSGVQLPKGGSAILFPNRNVLLVEGAKETISLLGDMCEAGCRLEPFVLRTELVLISLRGVTQSLEEPAPSYEALRRKAGDSWHEISRLEVISKTGMRGTGSVKSGAPVPGSASFSPEAKVFSAEVEIVVGPDGDSMDATVSVQFQGKADGFSQPLNVDFGGSTSLWTGKPQVLQVYQAGPVDPSYVLVMRSTISWPDRAPVKKP